MFFSKEWSVGRVVDYVAQRHRLTNQNNLLHAQVETWSIMCLCHLVGRIYFCGTDIFFLDEFEDENMSVNLTLVHIMSPHVPDFDQVGCNMSGRSVCVVAYNYCEPGFPGQL